MCDVNNSAEDFLKEFRIEMDMLTGNINRMFLEKDLMQIEYNFEFARIRLNRLHEIALSKFSGGVINE